MYEYGADLKAVDMPTFTEFFTKATWEFIKSRENKLRNKDQDKWKQPLININDSQTLMTATWVQMDRIKKGSSHIANDIFISGTTHTYRNRGFLGQYDKYWKTKFLSMGIPEQYHWILTNSNETIDLASIGLRCADYTKAVAGIHAYEVQNFDPMLKKLYGITNGDNLDFSTQKFTKMPQMGHLLKAITILVWC